MFRSFKAKNFRCLEDLTIGPLDRVNLIAGKNNAGKTSLLEALFLHTGWNNPSLPHTVNAIRGAGWAELTADSVWGWLFFEKRTGRTISLWAQAGTRSAEKLTIRLENLPEALLREGGKEEKSYLTGSILSTVQTPPQGLALKHEGPRGRTHYLWAWITTQGVKLAGTVNVNPPVGVFLSAHYGIVEENPDRFSRLKETGQDKKVVEAMRYLEPRLKDLSIITVAGKPIVSGDLGVGSLVPLPFLGEGMVRLLSIVLAIASAPGGVVLVDELENGFHYSVMKGVWRIIAATAREANCQVFASTHSWECIRAAHEAFSSDEVYDFRLHRLDRVKGGIRSVTYDQETLEGALVAGLEVR